MFRNKTVDAGIPVKIVERVSKMSRDDLVAWSDQAIYTTGRYLTQYGRDGLEENLSEAHTGAQVLLAVTEELRKRTRH